MPAHYWWLLFAVGLACLDLACASLCPAFSLKVCQFLDSLHLQTWIFNFSLLFFLFSPSPTLPSPSYSSPTHTLSLPHTHIHTLPHTHLHGISHIPVLFPLSGLASLCPSSSLLGSLCVLKIYLMIISLEICSEHSTSNMSQAESSSLCYWNVLYVPLSL